MKERRAWPTHEAARVKTQSINEFAEGGNANTLHDYQIID